MREIDQLGLEFDTGEHGGREALVLRGEIDFYTAGGLRAALSALMDAGRSDLLLDCITLEFLDSSALGVLVGAA